MPSAYAAIRAYSIPLCTILTKCPAPTGPTRRYPSSCIATLEAAPGVRGAAATPGARERKIGSIRSQTASSSHPTIRQKPRSSPKTPPEVPQST